MTDSGVETDKQVVRDFIEAVWMRQDLTALDRFWTDDCVNHAAPAGYDVGLQALRRHHEQFADIPLHTRGISNPQLLGNVLQHLHRHHQRIREERPQEPDGDQLQPEPQTRMITPMTRATEGQRR